MSNVVWTATDGWHDGPAAAVSTDDGGRIRSTVTGAGVTIRDNGLRYTVPDYVTAVQVDGQAPISGQTVSGYGGKIPTRYRLTYAGRNRRVYAMSYGNSASLFVMVGGDVAHLDTLTEHRLMAARDAR
jgi:hypothetical protein